MSVINATPGIILDLCDRLNTLTGHECHLAGRRRRAAGRQCPPEVAGQRRRRGAGACERGQGRDGGVCREVDSEKSSIGSVFPGRVTIDNG